MVHPCWTIRGVDNPQVGKTTMNHSLHCFLGPVLLLVILLFFSRKSTFWSPFKSLWDLIDSLSLFDLYISLGAPGYRIEKSKPHHLTQPLLANSHLVRPYSFLSKIACLPLSCTYIMSACTLDHQDRQSRWRWRNCAWSRSFWWPEFGPHAPAYWSWSASPWNDHCDKGTELWNFELYFFMNWYIAPRLLTQVYWP